MKVSHPSPLGKSPVGQFAILTHSVLAGCTRNSNFAALLLFCWHLTSLGDLCAFGLFEIFATFRNFNPMIFIRSYRYPPIITNSFLYILALGDFILLGCKYSNRVTDSFSYVYGCALRLISWLTYIPKSEEC